MKRLFSVFVLLIELAVISFAADYTCTLSTYNVKGTTSEFALGAYPQIADGVIVDKLVFSNSGTTLQTISIYDTATSTSAASLSQIFILPSSATATITIIDYPGHNPLKLRNMSVNKSSTATDVYMNVQYR